MAGRNKRKCLIYGIILIVLLGLFLLFLFLKSSPPKFSSVSVYPPKIKEGEVLLITAQLQDKIGIISAYAEIENEEGYEKSKFYLAEGTTQKGTWKADWVAHATKNQKWYNLTIKATNLFGKTAVFDTNYFDPEQNHPASEVTAGTFDSGNFVFPNNLNVTGNLTAAGSMIMPVGTTAQRTASPVSGMVRFNTETAKLEFYNGNLWTSSSSTMSATGGTITYSGAYIIHTFTSTGTFTVTGSGNVKVLVVAGGGQGGSTGGDPEAGGGGGAGGYQESASTAVTAQAYSIVIGDGGSGGNNGGSSSALGITSVGGGKGGFYNAAGVNGANGGGGGAPSKAGGTGTAGYNGGTAGTGGGGGGGGSGAIGTDGSGANGGNGGAGTASTISGASVTYAGGGGGGADSGGTPGTATGGGAGAASGGHGADATANTGGGGGGSADGTGGAGGTGGSGVVIISYLQ